MQKSSLMIVSYKIKHNYNVKEFLLAYQQLLQNAVNIIWSNITWIEKKGKLYPIIPKDKKFKKQLRDKLLQVWKYANHYVDSAIKTAYSILNSWRRNYVKGRRGRGKPIVERLFVRVKETLYTYKGGILRITIIPYKQYLEFDLNKAWFKNRVKGLDMGEPILTEDELMLTYRKQKEETKLNYAKAIGWDSNLFSLDGFSPVLGWIKVDTTKLFHTHRVHELKRKKAQSESTRKKSVKEKVKRHGERERNRAKDFTHKLTTGITSSFSGFTHGFEDLNKTGMFTKSKEHNREISKTDWKQIIRTMSYKSNVILVDPSNTSTTCPRCGGKMLKLRKGQVVRCEKCGLELDRQLCGAINIYLKMCGFPPPQAPSTVS